MYLASLLSGRLSRHVSSGVLIGLRRSITSLAISSVHRRGVGRAVSRHQHREQVRQLLVLPGSTRQARRRPQMRAAQCNAASRWFFRTQEDCTRRCSDSTQHRRLPHMDTPHLVAEQSLLLDKRCSPGRARSPTRAGPARSAAPASLVPEPAPEPPRPPLVLPVRPHARLQERLQSWRPARPRWASARTPTARSAARYGLPEAAAATPASGRRHAGGPAALEAPPAGLATARAAAGAPWWASAQVLRNLPDGL